MGVQRFVSGRFTNSLQCFQKTKLRVTLKMRLLLLLLALTGYVVSWPTFGHVNVDSNQGRPAVEAKTYVVDLSLAPAERWNAALSHVDPDDVRNAFHALMTRYLPSQALIDVIEVIAGDLDRYVSQPFADEMRGVSKALKMELGEIVIANLVYDVTAFNSSGFRACTSIVTIDKRGGIIHGRNLDYDVADLLKPLTMQVDFRKGGKSVFMATTYAGYIGVITGVRHGAFSISGDERDKGDLWENLLSALEHGWPTFFLQRMVLETAPDYETALNLLIRLPTIAPVYYIVGGLQPSEGAIIVKNRWDVLNVTSMENNWYVLETNYDPWTAPPASDDRRDAGIAAMNKVGRMQMDAQHLYDVLSVPLVFNSDTTYTTVMSAADPSVYRTMIRYDEPQN